MGYPEKTKDGLPEPFTFGQAIGGHVGACGCIRFADGRPRYRLGTTSPFFRGHIYHFIQSELVYSSDSFRWPLTVLIVSSTSQRTWLSGL